MLGKNNPMYGKPSWNKNKICPSLGNKYQHGSDNPNWKGGYPHCETCGKTLSNHKSKCCNGCIGYKRKGELNPRWCGGKSFEPYCPKFTTKLKEEIRNRYDRKCFLCGKPEKDNIRKLDVHHVDYDKEQGCGKGWELVPLCISCHTATTNSREKFQEEIRRKLMATENLQQKKAATIQKEADFAATNMGMQDRIKLDNKDGSLVSKEKEPKKGNAKLIGPN